MNKIRIQRELNNLKENYINSNFSDFSIRNMIISEKFIAD